MLVDEGVGVFEESFDVLVGDPSGFEFVEVSLELFSPVFDLASLLGALRLLAGFFEVQYVVLVVVAGHGDAVVVVVDPFEEACFLALVGLGVSGHRRRGNFHRVLKVSTD